MATGLLSQTIINLQNTVNTISNQQGLPPDAIAIQNEAKNNITQLIPAIKSTQTQVLETIKKIENLIKNSLILLQTDSVGVLGAYVNQARKDTLKVKAEVQQLHSKIETSYAVVVKDDQKLQSLMTQLNAKISSLQSELAGKQQEANALNKKKLYWLALGPFGLVGLSACIALIVTANKEVNKVKAQVNSVQQQISQQQGFANNVKNMTTDMESLVNRLSSITNTLDLISGDIENVSGDIDFGKINDKTTVQLFLKTALTQAQTLETDMS